MKAEPESYSGWHFDWHGLLEAIRNFKEVLWAVGIVATGTFWVVNYFATREQLEQLDCDRRVNERMLTSHGNVSNSRLLAETEHSNLINEQQELENIRNSSASTAASAERGCDTKEHREATLKSLNP